MVDDATSMPIQVTLTGVLYVQVELEVESLNRRLRLVEDELEQSRERLETSQDQLLDSTKLADETDRFVVTY